MYSIEVAYRWSGEKEIFWFLKFQTLSSLFSSVVNGNSSISRRFFQIFQFYTQTIDVSSQFASKFVAYVCMKIIELLSKCCANFENYLKNYRISTEFSTKLFSSETYF